MSENDFECFASTGVKLPDNVSEPLLSRLFRTLQSRDLGHSRLDNTGIRYSVLARANYAFSSFRSPELRQPI